MRLLRTYDTVCNLATWTGIGLSLLGGAVLGAHAAVVWLLDWLEVWR